MILDAYAAVMAALMATGVLLIVVAGACLLLLKQPDMGTALVICFAIGTLLIAAGTPVRLLGGIFGTLCALAVLVALAHALRERRPQGVRVLLLSTGSEESFMEGMQGFGRRHFGSLPRERGFDLAPG